MKITNVSNLDDGFGEHLKYLIYAIFYAEFSNSEFYYTPFTDSMQHNYENDPDFILKKEQLFGLRENYPIATKDCKSLSKLQYISFFEKNIHLYKHSKGIQKLKNIFREKNKKSKSTGLNIAIHIRRKNNPQDCNLPFVAGADVPNQVYIEIISVLSSIYKNSTFHIYSQGSPDDFQIFKNVKLHINESIEDTFIGMVYADVLVIAPSAFSYTAGILSDGIIYYIKHDHRRLPHWNVIEGYTSSRDRYTFYINGIKVYYDPDKEKFHVAASKAR